MLGNVKEYYDQKVAYIRGQSTDKKWSSAMVGAIDSKDFESMSIGSDDDVIIPDRTPPNTKKHKIIKA